MDRDSKMIVLTVEQMKTLQGKGLDITKYNTNLYWSYLTFYTSQIKSFWNLQINKNNKQISNEDIRMVDDFAENVKKSIKSFKSMTKLKSTMEEIESTYQNLKSENRELFRTVQIQQEEINNLKEEINFKDKIIQQESSTTIL